jgi:hypothetical protein
VGSESEESCLGKAWWLSSRLVLCFATIGVVRFCANTKFLQPNLRDPEN